MSYREDRAVHAIGVEPNGRPRISVIIVSDYSGNEAGWLDERRILKALATQDIHEPFEAILASSRAREALFPSDLLDIAPRTRAIFLPYARSSDLKNHALASASGALIAVMEADSSPRTEWLRLMVEALDRDQDATIISGRTIYGRESSLKRALSLIDRSFMDVRTLGTTRHVSNNGALYRRGVLEAFPYSDEKNPFVSGWLRNDRILQAGHKVLFHPDAIMVHEFGGLRFAVDVRRNIAFSDGRMHFLANGPVRDRRQRLRIAWRRLADDWRACRRAANAYIRWYDWMAVTVFLIGFKIIEWSALGDGLAGKADLGGTAYH